MCLCVFPSTYLTVASAHEYLVLRPERRASGKQGRTVGPGTHIPFSTSQERPASPHHLPPHSYSRALTSFFSVLISSDLLLADNNRNKEQHRFWHVCAFSPSLIFYAKKKKKKSRLSFTGFYCFRKEKK